MCYVNTKQPELPDESVSDNKNVDAEHQPSTSTTSTVPRDPRHWTNKRKPRPHVADQRAVATAHISELAQVKMAYYREKLEMERSEHRIRMEVLEMEKQQLLAKRLDIFREE
jgi:hypothetical protein